MKKNVLIITYWSFKDALVQTYTLPYIKMIRNVLPKDAKIFLTTFEQKKHKMSSVEVSNAKNRLMEDSNIRLMPFRYFSFGPKAAFRLIFVLFRLWLLIIFNGVKTIHCFAPSAGVLGVILKSLTGKRLIMDSFEPHAEAMVENGTWSKDSFAYRFQFRMEKKMAKKAFALIGTSDGMRQYVNKKYNIEPKRFYTKPAGVNFQLFNPKTYDNSKIRNEIFPNAEIIGFYSGKLGGIYLKDEVFEFLSVAANRWKEKFAFIMLTPNTQDEISELCKKHHFPEDQIKIFFVSHKEVPYYMAAADFAINPVKPVPSKRYCTSIKDGEYWAMGLPVIIPANISDDSEMIQQNNIGYVWQDFSQKEYLNSLQWIDDYLEGDKTIIQKQIIQTAISHRDMRKFERIYKEIYS